MKLFIHTDGASRGNPGPASYGFSIQGEDQKIIFEEGKFVGINTNNFAEYSAVLEALDTVRGKLQFRELAEIEINFLADSKLVVEQLSGRYKIKSANLIPLIKKIKELEANFKQVKYTHIPREQNKTADRLANEALDNR